MVARFAYISQGKLFCKDGDGPAKEIESPFGQEIVNRTLSIHEKHAWKTQGRGGQFMRGSMLWGCSDTDPQHVCVRVTGTTAAVTPGAVTYSLATDRVGGLFTYELSDGHEKRHFHKTDFQAQDLDRHPQTGRIACSLQAGNGGGNITVLDADGRGSDQVTEGDSMDQAPSWVHGEEETLVFQSAGIGRDPNGFPVGYGPFCVEQIDLGTNRMTTLLQDARWDFLQPHKTADGDLLFIRRPYELPGHTFSPVKLARDILLFPFRLLRAIFHFLNTFSMFFSGKPLTTASAGPMSQDADIRNMLLWGRMIDVQQALRKARGDEAPSLVPSSWELVRRSQNGAECVLATGVASFDTAKDGTVLYTNGSGVFAVDADGKSSRLCTGKVIDRVVAL